MKKVWGAYTALAPVPAVLVTVRDREGKDNVLTIGWVGTVCSKPPMLSISVRKERYSHPILMDTKQFVVNLTTEDLVKAVDYCGVKSGKDTDKFKDMHLTPEPASKVNVSLIKECPISIECKVTQVLELGSHDLFLANIVAVDVDESLIDASGRLALENSGLISYQHGEYFSLGECLGRFGYSVKKK